MCSGDKVPKIVEETLSEAPSLQLSNANSVSETIVAENEISKLKIAPPIEAVAEVDIVIPILPSHVDLPTISTTETAFPPPAPVSIPLHPVAPISSTSKKKSGTSKDTPSGATGGRGRCCSRYHKVLL